MNTILIEMLRQLYIDNGEYERFETDFNYLNAAYNDIEKLWQANLERLKQVTLVILAEAPLWGARKSYFYNLEVPATQFFYPSDLSHLAGKNITTKQQLVDTCIELGIIILDVSPFAFNEQTTFNYRKHSAILYPLVNQSFDHFLIPKLNQVLQIARTPLKLAFRYKRVQQRLQRQMIQHLAQANVELHKTHLSQGAGGINRQQLAELLN